MFKQTFMSSMSNVCNIFVEAKCFIMYLDRKMHFDLDIGLRMPKAH